MTRESLSGRLDPSRPRRIPVRVLQLVVDLFALNAIYRIVLLIRFGNALELTESALRGAPPSIYGELELFISVAWLLISAWLKLYGKARRSSLEEIRGIVRASLLLGLGVVLFVVARGGYNFYSRLFLLYFAAATPVVMALVRLAIHSTASTIRSQAVGRKNIIIVGAGNPGERFYRTVADNPSYGYRVIGFLDDNGVHSKVRPMILGKLHDLAEVATNYAVDEIVIALPRSGGDKAVSRLIKQCEDKCLRVAVLADADPVALETKTLIEHVGEFSVLRLRQAPLDLKIHRIAKRAFDIIFSLIVLSVVFPIVWLVTAIAIKTSSRGPVMFRQLRTGEDGQSFWCYKFRTMVPSAFADELQAHAGDPRLTRFGRVLRRTSLDELPQFWNVLKGEMSVVGPRPHMLKHTEDYRNIISQYMVRHFVKPGVTGWAQVSGLRGATTPEQMERRIEYDLYYIENWSFLFDLLIVFRTIGTILSPDENAY
jgi:putative colanic acid biosynthesis UDP-glucose lipid carrier transferase